MEETGIQQKNGQERDSKCERKVNWRVFKNMGGKGIEEWKGKVQENKRESYIKIGGKCIGNWIGKG